MDDESYFKYVFSTLPGTRFYITREKFEVFEKEMTISIEKFGHKVMVQQTISQ